MKCRECKKHTDINYGSEKGVLCKNCFKELKEKAKKDIINKFNNLNIF